MLVLHFVFLECRIAFLASFNRTSYVLLLATLGVGCREGEGSL
jgi:hypothetical protein